MSFQKTPVNRVKKNLKKKPTFFLSIKLSCQKNPKIFSVNKEGLMGNVTTGIREELVCIPGNSSITVPGMVNKLPHSTTCLVDQAAHCSLPSGIAEGVKKTSTS